MSRDIYKEMMEQQKKHDDSGTYEVVGVKKDITDWMSVDEFKTQEKVLCYCGDDYFVIGYIDGDKCYTDIDNYDDIKDTDDGSCITFIGFKMLIKPSIIY